jgi:hypothetical protein
MKYMNIENFVRALADAVASECGLVDNDMDGHYQDYKVENGKILSVTTEGETMTVNEIFHNCVFAEAVIDSTLCKYIAMCANGYNIRKLVLPSDFYYVGINNPNDENDAIVIQNNKRFMFA